MQPVHFIYGSAAKHAHWGDNSNAAVKASEALTSNKTCHKQFHTGCSNYVKGRRRHLKSDGERLSGLGAFIEWFIYWAVPNTFGETAKAAERPHDDTWGRRWPAPHPQCEQHPQLSEKFEDFSKKAETLRQFGLTWTWKHSLGRIIAKAPPSTWQPERQWGAYNHS